MPSGLFFHNPFIFYQDTQVNISGMLASGILQSSGVNFTVSGFNNGEPLWQIDTAQIGVYQSGQLILFNPALSGGGASLTSGCILSGMLAASDTTPPVASGNIASGVVGNIHVFSGGFRSGAYGSGSIGNIHVFSGGFLSGAVASGSLGNIQVASGGFLSGAYGSGSIGNVHIFSGGLGSGAIGSGQIGHPLLGSGGVLSGDIASGQVGINHFQSGTVADQTLMEAGTSLTSFTTPGKQQFHPSAAKAWVRWNSAATIAASYNISGITVPGTGQYVISYTVAFSSVNYAIACSTGVNTGGGNVLWMSAHSNTATPAAGSCRVITVSNSTTADASDFNFFSAFGDQ